MSEPIDVLHQMWEAYSQDEEPPEDLGRFEEYGLCFDYVYANTFSDQEEGFFRYQLSTGGPGDEFRFYLTMDKSLYKVEYVFLDWFDGATRKLHGTDLELLTEMWDSYFSECVDWEAIQDCID
jgi:hypothetical protein